VTVPINEIVCGDCLDVMRGRGGCSMGRQVIAFSGGKDSTALALRWSELGRPAELLHTSTGNEPPDVAPHVQQIAAMTGYRLHVIQAGIAEAGGDHLIAGIRRKHMIPTKRFRWCTSVLKYEPLKRWFREHGDGVTILSGLRADEPCRTGFRSMPICYPLREWGWGIAEVMMYLEARHVTIPRQTNCMLCPLQSRRSWRWLYETHPEMYATGEQIEAEINFTFLRPEYGRETCTLREQRYTFETGVPYAERRAGQGGLFDG